MILTYVKHQIKYFKNSRESRLSFHPIS